MGFQVKQTSLPDVWIIEPQIFQDARGFFYESYNSEFLRELGLNVGFVQDNHSFSTRNVVRGLHYQLPNAQGKLVRVVTGEVFDVSVNLRRSSICFGKWVGVHLSAANRRMLWIPPGFAHGFAVLSDTADVLYKTTEYYRPDSEHVLRWDDPTVGIVWQLGGEPVLSERDRNGVLLRDAEVYVE